MDRIADSQTILPAAMLFDMDGTLTAPMLDFPAIKAEMGIGNRPILEALAELSDSRRAEAEAILLRHEEHAAANSQLNPGCRELLVWIAERQIPTALITRNSRRSVELFVERHGLAMEVLITRDDPPFKPSPHPLLLGCSGLNVDPAQVWMIGDGQYDVEAGVAAGIKTVWISHRREKSFDATPWMIVQTLCQLHELLRKPPP